MQFLRLSAASLLTLVLVAGATRLSAEDRPNVLVIVADDLGWNDVGWHGGWLKTPNLDQLCRDGVELDRHYVSPMCSPTRAALLSGRYASRFGVTAAQNERVFPFGTTTLAGALREAGYETGLIGKWHLGSHPEWGPGKFGFDHSYGSLAGGCGPWDHRYKFGPYTDTWHRNGEHLEEEGHVTDLIAEEAVGWLAGRGEKPFFLYVPFTAPHIPIKEPQLWLNLYPEIREPDRQQYAACVSHLDHAVGEIVAALERNNQREKTLILFFSDNGGTQARNDDTKYPADGYVAGHAHGDNRPLRGNKTQLYEGGIRVPAFVSWKGTLKPGKLEVPVHAVDWMPSLCSLADFQPKSDLNWDGQNIWPWLTGEASPKPRPLYWAGTGFRTAAVLDDGWKLIAARDEDKVELFQLETDPSEKHDLADAEPQRVELLRDLLAQLAARDNDARVKDEKEE